MKIIKSLICLLLVLIVSACGFHLAGDADLDPVFDRSHVTYQPGSGGQRMAELTEQQLKANKIKLVTEEEASARVNILYERKRREVLSVDEDGKVSEYELIIEIGVRVTDAEKKRLMKDQNIRLSRDFLFDVDDVLGKGREEFVVYEEMRADLARLIIYRLQAVSTET